MSDTVIVYAHPYEKSFNAAILAETCRLLEDKGRRFRVLDLYRDGFNPVYSKEELALFNQGKALDERVLEYQAALRNCNRLIFIFPIWWADMPAVVKGFLDKVFLKNLTYAENKVGLLEGRLTNIEEATVISTSTAPTWYLKYFCGNVITKAMLNHTLKGVGVQKRRWINCGKANKENHEYRVRFLQKLADYL